MNVLSSVKKTTEMVEVRLEKNTEWDISDYMSKTKYEVFTVI